VPQCGKVWGSISGSALPTTIPRAAGARNVLPIRGTAGACTVRGEPPGNPGLVGNVCVMGVMCTGSLGLEGGGFVEGKMINPDLYDIECLKTFL
jgi:hypothetical protein